MTLIQPAHSLDLTRIRAISLDLDDTLWPIWPLIARCEQVLLDWLSAHAPGAAALAATPDARLQVREALARERPDLAHDLSALRRESIRRVLTQAGEDPALAEPAFEVFFAERQRVELYPDARPALDHLAARYPLIALSNGNADIHRVGLGSYFKTAFSAREFGIAKPDPRIFHAAAASLGVRPEEVLHVGDDAHLDGVGALDASMQFAWLNRESHPWPPGPRAPHLTVTGLKALCLVLE
jgi:putative hydrolase of the HAD superfamily